MASRDTAILHMHQAPEDNRVSCACPYNDMEVAPLSSHVVQMAASLQHQIAAPCSAPPAGLPNHVQLIRRQLDFLARHLGIRWEPVEDSPTRFRLLIPYCYELLNWQVEFQRLRDVWVPDLILSEENCNPLLSQLPSAHGFADILRNWDMGEERQLAQLITKVIAIFRDLQKDLMAAAADSRLQFELDTVAGEGGPSRVDLLFLSGAPSKPAKAVFVVGVDGVDLRCLRHFLAKGLPPGELERLQQQLFLRVAYPLYSNAAPQTTFHMPPYLRDIVGIPRLPHWGSGMSLIQYLPEVAEAVQTHCVLASTSADLRWQLLRELAETKLGPALEMDTTASRSAMFRITHNGIPTTLFLDIPTTFPEDPPCLSLQGAAEECLQQYPWSPRWEPKEMAKRIYGVVKDHLPKKQKDARPLSASPPLVGGQ